MLPDAEIPLQINSLGSKKLLVVCMQFTLLGLLLLTMANGSTVNLCALGVSKAFDKMVSLLN